MIRERNKAAWTIEAQSTKVLETRRGRTRGTYLLMRGQWAAAENQAAMVRAPDCPWTQHSAATFMWSGVIVAAPLSANQSRSFKLGISLHSVTLNSCRKITNPDELHLNYTRKLPQNQKRWQSNNIESNQCCTNDWLINHLYSTDWLIIAVHMITLPINELNSSLLM